jgi:hypothetical protein
MGISASGGGISQSLVGAHAPTIAWHDGQLFAGWLDREVAATEVGPVARLARFHGSDWEPVTAVPAELATGAHRSLQLASGGGQLYAAWQPALQPGLVSSNRGPAYVASWSGSGFVEQLAGDASGAGSIRSEATLSSLDLSVDTNGRPYLAWQESGPGAAAHVGFRGNLLPPFAPERTFVADGSAGKTIAALLAAHSLGAGDAIVIHGSWSEHVTITAAHAGVAIFAAPGSTMERKPDDHRR